MKNKKKKKKKKKTPGQLTKEFQGCHAEVERQRQSGANGDDDTSTDFLSTASATSNTSRKRSHPISSVYGFRALLCNLVWKSVIDEYEIDVGRLRFRFGRLQDIVEFILGKTELGKFHLLDYMQELIDVDDAATITITRIANRLIFDQLSMHLPPHQEPVTDSSIYDAVDVRAGKNFDNFITLAKILRSSYDFRHTTNPEVNPHGESSITKPTLRLLNPFDELFVDSKDVIEFDEANDVKQEIKTLKDPETLEDDDGNVEVQSSMEQLQNGKLKVGSTRRFGNVIFGA
ncbi:hypothetical protein L2E82_00125 [Cichorium intybus]|uniref:Uncharacterized protein n=1 Tax=Cichorium intybus TaxID=13427 RepID=A0ACB9GXC4_CICIN|nr:hypothetical protein L2E82_00125 [Cichorium intybus]